jgi:hypothetical protein
MFHLSDFWDFQRKGTRHPSEIYIFRWAFIFDPQHREAWSDFPDRLFDHYSMIKLTVNSPPKIDKILAKVWLHQSTVVLIVKFHHVVACLCAVYKNSSIDGNIIAHTLDFLLRKKWAPRTARQARRMKDISSPVNCSSLVRKSNHRKVLTMSHW